MSIILLSIVEVSMNKIALWIPVDVDDWTAERAIMRAFSLIQTFVIKLTQLGQFCCIIGLRLHAIRDKNVLTTIHCFSSMQ